MFLLHSCFIIGSHKSMKTARVRKLASQNKRPFYLMNSTMALPRRVFLISWYILSLVNHIQTGLFFLPRTGGGGGGRGIGQNGRTFTHNNELAWRAIQA